MLVLIVDDNQVNRLILSKMVERLGADVACACDGQEALAAVQSKQPDMVLMDLSMPVMDGFTATRLIRESLDAQQLPVHAVSAHATEPYRDRCKSGGFNSFIPKPVDRSEIARLLTSD